MDFYFENLLWKLFLLSGTILILVVFYMKWAFSYWKRLGVPYVEPKLPFGNFNSTFFGKETLGSPVWKMYEDLKRKGFKYGGGYIITKPVFLPIDPEMIKQVLIKDFGKFQDRGIYYNEKDDPLSASLFSIEKQKWRNLRNKLSPCFTSGKLKSMFQMFVNCAKNLEEVLEGICINGEALDIKDISARFTTDIISSTAFGLECSSLTNPQEQFRKYGKKHFEVTFLESVTLIFAFIWRDVLQFFRVKLTKPSVEKFFMDTIKQTVDFRERNNIDRNDMLNLLIKLKNNQSIEDNPGTKKDSDVSITFNELAAQCFVFFLGGFETSSTTMSFALLELSQNPEIQQKLREEIKLVLEKHRNLTYEAIMDMPYMDKVVHETLRKYPPLPFLDRELNEDWKIPGSDIILKKGTAIMISNFGVQRDPEFYPDPEKFDPERFSEEEKAKRPAMAYLPFGDGPRNCIGLRFGYLQTKVGLATFLKNYKFSIHPKMVLPIVFHHTSFILTHKFDILLNIKKI